MDVMTAGRGLPALTVRKGNLTPCTRRTTHGFIKEDAGHRDLGCASVVGDDPHSWRDC